MASNESNKHCRSSSSTPPLIDNNNGQSTQCAAVTTLTEELECRPTIGMQCVVCSAECLEPARMYFGAQICEACKMFYIRSTRNGEPTFRCVLTDQCQITPTSRTCQSCRYQKCLDVGMCRKAKHLLPPTETPPDNEPCKVCSGVSSGIHFGVLTCKACKEYFRRHMHTDTHSLLRCLGKEKNCPVTFTTRTMCRYCRYQKCLAAGMSKAAVKIGRRRKYKLSQKMSDPFTSIQPIQYHSKPCTAGGNGGESTTTNLDIRESKHEVDANATPAEGMPVIKDSIKRTPQYSVRNTPSISDSLGYVRDTTQNRLSTMDHGRSQPTSIEKATRRHVGQGDANSLAPFTSDSIFGSPPINLTPKAMESLDSTQSPSTNDSNSSFRQITTVSMTYSDSTSPYQQEDSAFNRRHVDSVRSSTCVDSTSGILSTVGKRSPDSKSIQSPAISGSRRSDASLTFPPLYMYTRSGYIDPTTKQSTKDSFPPYPPFGNYDCGMHGPLSRMYGPGSSRQLTSHDTSEAIIYTHPHFYTDAVYKHSKSPTDAICTHPQLHTDSKPLHLHTAAASAQGYPPLTHPLYVSAPTPLFSHDKEVPMTNLHRLGSHNNPPAMLSTSQASEFDKSSEFDNTSLNQNSMPTTSPRQTSSSFIEQSHHRSSPVFRKRTLSHSSDHGDANTSDTGDDDSVGMIQLGVTQQILPVSMSDGHPCSDTVSMSDGHPCPDAVSMSDGHPCSDAVSMPDGHPCYDTVSMSDGHPCPDAVSMSDGHPCSDAVSMSDGHPSSDAVPAMEEDTSIPCSSSKPSRERYARWTAENRASKEAQGPTPTDRTLTLDTTTTANDWESKLPILDQMYFEQIQHRMNLGYDQGEILSKESEAQIRKLEQTETVSREEGQHIASEILHAFEIMKTKNTELKFPQTGLDKVNPPSNNDAFKVMQDKIVVFLTFIKRIPGFRDLQVKDQMVLCRFGLFPMAIISITSHPLAYQIVQHIFQPMFKLLEPHLKEFKRRFQQFEIDFTHISLVMALVAFNPDLPLIVDKDAIVKKHWIIRQILRQHCKDKQESVKKYNHLLSLVLDLYRIEYYHKQSVQRYVSDTASSTAALQLPLLFAELNL